MSTYRLATDRHPVFLTNRENQYVEYLERQGHDLATQDEMFLAAFPKHVTNVPSTRRPVIVYYAEIDGRRCAGPFVDEVNAQVAADAIGGSVTSEARQPR